MSRCQWMMSRGYHKGCQCGNGAVADNCGIKLCALHLGMATTRPVCNASRGCITEHGRWRDRKGNCQGCGKPANESLAPLPSMPAHGVLAPVEAGRQP